MKKASILGVVLVAVVIGLIVLAKRPGGQSSVLLQDAVARAGPDGAVMITLVMTNAETPVTLRGLSSPEAASAELSVVEAVVLPSGSSPVLAAEGVYGRLIDLQGPLDDGRLIPVTLHFSDGDARTKARVSTSEENPHAGHFMAVDAEGLALALDVAKDGAGWVVRVEAPGLEFSRDNADGPHVPGQGHGHLYLNGLKLQRLYGSEARIGALPAGSHRVTVTLNANDHRAYVVDGKPLEAETRIEVR